MAPDGYGTGVWQPQGPAADDPPPQGPSGSEPEDPLRDDQATWHGATPGTGVSNPGTWGWNDSWWQSNDWHQSGRSWTSDQWRDHWSDGQFGWSQWPTGWGRRGSWGDSWTTTSASTGDHEQGSNGDNDDQGSWNTPGKGQSSDAGNRGPSEKMVVPGFSGSDDGEELGNSARSYLRQIAAWQKMTKLTADKQALVLYQHLSGPAWVEAERLDMDKLGSRDGPEYFKQWIRDRYLDVQVTQIGRSLSEFFRRLRKKPGQSIRDYCGEFDRAHARLLECGCVLPDMACAWVFIDRMNLDEASELNLLSSVNNVYDLKLLQRAAIVQDRALRKPWENPSGTANGSKGGRGNGWWKKSVHTANLTELEEELDLEIAIEDEEPIQEEDAEHLYETYMTHISAKQKYKDNIRMRGSDPDAIRRVATEKLRLVKSKSFCAGCRRRGHWHKDPECPLNQASGGAAARGGHPHPTSTTTSSSTSASTPRPQLPSASTPKPQLPKENFPCHVVHVTWDLETDKGGTLEAITDTACSKTVAGTPWMDSFLAEARRSGFEPEVVGTKDAFKFGASKVFEASYAVFVTFGLGNYVVKIKVCVVHGDVPLLLSRSVLGGLGMILDIARNKADFRSVGVHDLQLQVTETGHPALPVKPESFVSHGTVRSKDEELQIVAKQSQYTVFAATSSSDEVESKCQSDRIMSIPTLFYPKKIGLATRNMILRRPTGGAHSFAAWWKGTSISNDFWVEDEHVLVRVHVIPRKLCFDPRGWTTTATQQKQDLLGTLGEIRSTWGVSCKDFRELCPLHEIWRHDKPCSTYATLWIGRTVFARKPMRSTSSASALPVSEHHGTQGRAFDRPRRDPDQGTLGVDEGGTGGRRECPWPLDQSGLDGTGNPVDDQGGHGCDRGTHRQQASPGNLEDGPRRAHHDGPPAQYRGATEGHEGGPDALDPGQQLRWQPVGPHVRPLPQLLVLGDSGRLPEMGHPRDEHKCQLQRGAEALCQLVQGPHGGGGPAHEVCEPRRCGVECTDSVCTGGVRGHKLGADVPPRAEECLPDHYNCEGDTQAEGRAEGRTSTSTTRICRSERAQPQGHGGGVGPGRAGRDPTLGDPVGCDPRSTRTVAQQRGRGPPGRELSEEGVGDASGVLDPRNHRAFGAGAWRREDLYTNEKKPNYPDNEPYKIGRKDDEPYGMTVDHYEARKSNEDEDKRGIEGNLYINEKRPSYPNNEPYEHNFGNHEPHGMTDEFLKDKNPIDDRGQSNLYTDEKNTNYPDNEPCGTVFVVGDAGDPGPMLQEGDAGDPGPFSVKDKNPIGGRGQSDLYTDEKNTNYPDNEPCGTVFVVGDAGDPGPMLQEGDAGDPGPLSGERGGDSRHHELSERVPQYILETEDTEALQIRQHRLREERGKRPIFVEIYAGKGLLGKMMEAQGYETISIDLPHWDLDKKDCRLQLLQLVVDLEPEIVWCAPACTLWSSLQNLNVKNAQDFAVLDDARCRHHRTHLSMVAKIYDIQRRGGRLAVVEHPKGSLAWQSKAFESLQGHTVMLDMCAYGATGTTPDGGTNFIKKPTRLQTTSLQLAELLSKKCTKDHQHVPLLGTQPGGEPRARSAAVYQDGFCGSVSDALHKSFTDLTDKAIPVQRPRAGQEYAQEGEALAARKLKEKAFTLEDIQEVVEALNLSRRKRHRRIYGGKEVYVEGVLGDFGHMGT